ncbi:MAG TPA: hypothetical protein VF445_05480 [Bordetella sp.]|uniref:hypothetical protein n=1 Tax=Bordetella sp. TaxID=28081 RepID=UPI002ED0B855
MILFIGFAEAAQTWDGVSGQYGGPCDPAASASHCAITVLVADRGVDGNVRSVQRRDTLICERGFNSCRLGTVSGTRQVPYASVRMAAAIPSIFGKRKIRVNRPMGARMQNVNTCDSSDCWRGDKSSRQREAQRKLNKKTYGLLPGVFAVLLAISGCSSDRHLSFLDPQGPIAALERWHFFGVLTVLVVLVAIPVFLLTPWVAWRYRYGAKSSHYAPKWASSWPLEVAAWGGPVVIVSVLALVLWRDAHVLDPYKPLVSDKAALRIQVIGYDWKWLFIYPRQGIASIGLLAVPVGQPLAMQLTSATVMQSFLIPALGSQIYAMGGMVSQLHLLAAKPGKFLGENTMFNGRGFHQQQFTAVAMTPDQFEAWVREVRANGIPMDERTLKAISQPGTRAELIAALPHGKSSDGNVYLTGVTAALFPAVVKATMGGAAVPSVNAPMGTASTSPSALRQPANSDMEKRQ